MWRGLEEISWTQVDSRPRHRDDKADVTKTCKTEALENEIGLCEEQFHLPRHGIYWGDSNLEKKRSFYNGNWAKLGWKGYDENQRGMKNSNVNAKINKERKKLNVERISQILW